MDIWPAFFKFRTFDIRDGEIENYFIVEYDSGHIYAHIVGTDRITKKEYMYIHLQKRQMTLQITDTNRYCIIPNAFVDYDNNMINCEYISSINECKKINYEGSSQNERDSFIDTLIDIKRLFRKMIWRIRRLTKEGDTKGDYV